MRRNRASMKKERIIMLASSVFVLTALTMTGFYVKEKNEAEKEGYIVDMSALEKKTEDKTKELAESVEKDAEDSVAEVTGNDLDYDPNFQEVSSGDVTNLWESAKKEEPKAEIEAEAEEADTEIIKEEEVVKAETAKAETEDVKAPVSEETDEEETAEVSSNVATALSFHEKDNLGWPVSGNVLINYSMDKTVYFSTLEQYKYNPAIVIAASEGENITASADGKVISVFHDPEIGHGVTMDIGNGYELTYGQLKDITLMQGDIVSAGDIIGKVAAPTKYYSKEGANVYFKLTRDGTPVNPLSSLE